MTEFRKAVNHARAHVNALPITFSYLGKACHTTISSLAPKLI